MTMFATPASQFADTLRALPVNQRRNAVACAVIETGGLYPFRLPYHAAPEIQLYSIVAAGWSEDEAIQNWIDTARKPPSNIRATDGRPDCPYNGQGVAPSPDRPPRALASATPR